MPQRTRRHNSALNCRAQCDLFPPPYSRLVFPAHRFAGDASDILEFWFALLPQEKTRKEREGKDEDGGTRWFCEAGTSGGP